MQSEAAAQPPALAQPPRTPGRTSQRTTNGDMVTTYLESFTIWAQARPRSLLIATPPCYLLALRDTPYILAIYAARRDRTPAHTL